MKKIDKNLFGEVTMEFLLPEQKRKKQKLLYDYFGLDFLDRIPTSGAYHMPILKPFNGDIPDRILPFDKAYALKDTNCIVHFYEDDRRFLRLFRNPDNYIPFLTKCALVIEPDLSQYANMPYPIRYANAYLNRAMAVRIQQDGGNVVSNLTWSLKDSYGYSIEGRPQKSIVAVNCTGIISSNLSKYLWRQGYNNVVLPLNPTRIIRYGDRVPGERTDISVYFENDNLRRLRHGS